MVFFVCGWFVCRLCAVGGLLCVLFGVCLLLCWGVLLLLRFVSLCWLVVVSLVCVGWVGVLLSLCWLWCCALFAHV